MTAVLFVTDGYPTLCDANMDSIVETVGEFYWGVVGNYNSVGKPGIRSYFVGVGADFGSLNSGMIDSVASLGGSTEALHGDTKEAVALAMKNIVSFSNQCDFAVPVPPSGVVFDPSKVQVIYSPTDGEPQEIPAASSAAGCDSQNGGWYYDDHNAPTKVSLCPCSCANIGAGSMQVRFGCRPIPIVD